MILFLKINMKVRKCMTEKEKRDKQELYNANYDNEIIEEMKTKRDALNEIVQNLTVKLYEQAAQQQAEQDPEAAQGGADDIVDADFEEVDND